MNSKKKIREFVLLEKSTPRKACVTAHNTRERVLQYEKIRIRTVYW